MAMVGTILIGKTSETAKNHTTRHPPGPAVWLNFMVASHELYPASTGKDTLRVGAAATFPCLITAVVEPRSCAMIFYSFVGFSHFVEIVICFWLNF